MMGSGIIVPRPESLTAKPAKLVRKNEIEDP
jgi:hypothetical protein